MREKIENLAPDKEYMQEDKKWLVIQKENVLLHEYEKYLTHNCLMDKEKEFFNEIEDLYKNCFLSQEQKQALGQLFMQFKVNLIDAFANCKKVYIYMGYKVNFLNKNKCKT